MDFADSPSLCIFANFFIDNAERLQRMKDSFFSFRAVNPDQWKINIRGRFKHEASRFLRSELGSCLDVYFLESKKGWFHDSRLFACEINSDYVLFWIEDHICMVNPFLLRQIIKEMSVLSVDQLLYTWFHPGSFQVFSNLPKLSSLTCITSYSLNSDTAKHVRRAIGRDFYSISAASIFKKEFFLGLLDSRRPYLKRWPRHLPFDFEKKSTDFSQFSLISAMPVNELFAAIDDDHGHPGYSLISRGKYPNRCSRYQLQLMENSVTTPRSTPVKTGSFVFSLIPLPLKILFAKMTFLPKRICYSIASFLE